MYGFIELNGWPVSVEIIFPLFLNPLPVLETGMPRPGSAELSGPAPGKPAA